MSAKLFHLLKYYQPKNIGLTIPFILGALRQPVGKVLSSAESLEELRALLVALRDDVPDLSKAHIIPCSNLHEPIVTLFGAEMSGSVRFDSPLAQGRSLYVHLFEIYDNDFEFLVNNLWERYETNLLEGRFSKPKNSNSWEAFDETELTNLRKCFEIE